MLNDACLPCELNRTHCLTASWFKQSYSNLLYKPLQTTLPTMPTPYTSSLTFLSSVSVEGEVVTISGKSFKGSAARKAPEQRRRLRGQPALADRKCSEATDMFYVTPMQTRSARQLGHKIGLCLQQERATNGTRPGTCTHPLPPALRLPRPHALATMGLPTS